MLNFSQTRLLITDMAASVRFYRDALGLEMLTGSEADVYCAFRLNDHVTLALFGRDAMREAIGAAAVPVSGDAVVLNFMVDHLDAAMQTLAARGVKFLAEPVVRPDWGMRTVHFRDPDGNLLEAAESSPMPAG